jgi:hypothetical protein
VSTNPGKGAGDDAPDGRDHLGGRFLLLDRSVVARGLDDETATCSLGQMLELGAVDEQELYATLDWLMGQQERIEQALARRHLRWFSTTSPRPISRAAPVPWPS